MFNPYIASKKIKEELIDYIRTIFPFSDAKIKAKFNDRLNEIISNGPYLDIKPSFDIQNSIDSLINEGYLSPLFRDLEAKKPQDKNYKIQLPLSRPLYTHQVEAIKKAKTNNLVITTGTGSGKTECFLLPIINELLEEKEKTGRISDQVKVILIYPMNALANDQLKRLRNILMYYPDITFGSYTGETATSEISAQKKYADLHSDEELEELKDTESHCGLINEIKSREEMWNKAPNILITNYVMLERLLLIPNNDILFKNSDIRYIVLDEAHVYQGARGMETSLLIRRLLARFDSEKTRFILTSATLGEKGKSEDQICEFAHNLTSKFFDKNSIIYGKRRSINFNGEKKVIPEEFFIQLANNLDDKDDFYFICDQFEIPYNDNLSIRENIYNICYNTIYFYNLNNLYLDMNKIILDVNQLPGYLGINTIEGAISFIFVSSFGEKQGIVLIDSKYHYFLRALEGCFISFSKSNNIFLERKLLDEEDYKVFELSICKKCGDLSLVGVIKDNYLEQSNGFLDNKNSIRYFHFIDNIADGELEDTDIDEIDLEDIVSDEDFRDKKGTHKINKYYLCPKCGYICKSEDGKPRCDCGVTPMVLYSTEKNYSGCLVCNGGRYNRFYLGNDSATSVIASSLFEELPIKSVTTNKNGINMSIDAGKQFLVFSDSRSEAAYFSSYLDKSYEIFLRRRAIFHEMKKNDKYLIDEPMLVNEFVEKVADLFYKNKTFRENILEEGRNLREKSVKNSWYGLLTEMISQKKRNSLTSLGIISFEYRGIDYLVESVLKHPKYGKIVDKNNIRQLLNEMVMTTVYWGAIDPIDDYLLNDDDRLFIFYSKKKKYITLNKDYVDNEDAYKTRNIMSWLPRIRKNATGYVKNSRYDIASKLLKTDDYGLIIDFLTYIFNFITRFVRNNNEECSMNVDYGNCYYFKPSSFIIKSPNDNSLRWYKCSKCGRISNYCLDDCKCSDLSCDGDVIEIDVNTYFEKNHYRNMYSSNQFKKLFIKEHTAQISRDDSLKYQKEFENNKINALSCSTTFEMGVDLGTLETVFLRDVPPNPSNYTQRSGRAGRSTSSSAFTLTYAKLSSHDFNYFKRPKEMIDGIIMPPKFKINNEKVVLRHIYAVVLSYLLKTHNISLNANEVLTDDVLLQIRSFLNEKEKNVELTNILKASFADINCNGMRAWDYSWVDKFCGDNGALTLLINDYLYTLDEYQKLIELDQQRLNNERDNEKKKKINALLNHHIDQQTVYKKQNIIDAFSKGNVLPKYGFPVDNVSLDIGNPKIDLSRDLSLAISEYAPGETVVANGKKYVSRYINKKVVGKDKNKVFKECYFIKCHNCNTYNYSNVEITKDDIKRCSGCGIELKPDSWQKSIVPEDGFYHDDKLYGEVSILNKPERIYTSEDCYVGDNKEILKTTYCFNDKLITLKHTENDEIMVVSNAPFYVCDYCGYTYGVFDIIKDEHGKRDKKIEKEINRKSKNIVVSCTHNNKFGKECTNKHFTRYKLTHVYKTDVVQMIFNNVINNDINQMYSVMTAILDSISYNLDIERTDISGCIKKVNDNLSIIIYDSVPGGAGHVKRLLDENGDTLYNIFYSALEKMKNCNCGSSCYNCLRNYYNQKYHDILDRNSVIDYLSLFIGNHCKVNISDRNNLIEKNILEYKEKNQDELIDILKEIIRYLDDEDKSNYQYLINKLEHNTITIPTYRDLVCKIDNLSYDIIAKWDNEKVILVDSDLSYNKLKDDSIYSVYNLNDKSDILNFISKVRG